MPTVHDKVLDLRDAVTAELVGRGEFVDLLVLALVAKHNVFTVSNPGTAKTTTFWRLVTRIADARNFGITFSRHTTPDAVFGPQSIQGLINDEFRRKVDGFAPTAHLAMFDELPRASEATANGLLELINERTYDQDGRKEKASLWVAFAFANSMLQAEHDGLGACADRFMLRFKLDDLTSSDDLRALWDVELAPNPQKVVTWDDIVAAHTAAMDVKIPDAVFDAALTVKRAATDLGVEISNRRWRESKRIIQARAWLNDRTAAEVDDIEDLAACFWTDPEQIPKVEKAVAAVCAPRLREALDWADAVTELEETILRLAADPGTDWPSEAPALLAKIKDAGKHVTDLAAATTGRTGRIANGALTRVAATWDTHGPTIMQTPTPLPLDILLATGR